DGLLRLVAALVLVRTRDGERALALLVGLGHGLLVVRIAPAADLAAGAGIGDALLADDLALAVLLHLLGQARVRADLRLHRADRDADAGGLGVRHAVGAADHLDLSPVRGDEDVVGLLGLAGAQPREDLAVGIVLRVDRDRPAEARLVHLRVADLEADHAD